MNSDARGYLGKMVTIQMDRPQGSRHPKHGYVYPVNYGFVPGTLAPDGAELDAYVLGIGEPREEFTGECIAVIHRTNDDDDSWWSYPEEPVSPMTRSAARCIFKSDSSSPKSSVYENPPARRGAAVLVMPSADQFEDL